MGTFLNSASRQVVDVRSFLRDSAGGNSIKYAAEPGAKHLIYIPFTQTEVIKEDGTKGILRQIHAIQGAVHEWTNADGKYKASICLKDVIRKAEDGTVLNDGTCPFCDRVSDAWDIYRYRKEQEEENCRLTGEQRKNHMEKAVATFADERKAKDARFYMYILIVKFRTDANGTPVMEDGLPAYDLKVMKLSASRIEKITQQLENAGTELAGAELMFGYPKNEDRRLVVSQSTTSPVFPTNQLLVKHPALINKINADVSKFTWDGIEKSFPEWSGMTSMEAKATTDSLFEKWDEYKKEVIANPGAKYLEYINETPSTTPEINPTVPGMGMPVVPQIPGATAAPQAGMPVMPGAPIMPGAPQMPNVDPNAMFSGMAPNIPVI